jgi:hypothetical protein
MSTIRDIVISGLTEIGKKNSLSGLELEGFVNKSELIFVTKVKEYNKIKHKSVERSATAEKIQKRLAEKKRERLNISLFNPIQISILSNACSIHEVTLEEAGSSKRTREIVDCRYQVYAILVLYLNMTIKSAGVLFNQDHSTVINGLRKHSDFLETDKIYLSKFVKLVTNLKAAHEDLFEDIDPTKAIKKYATNDYITRKMITFERTRLTYKHLKNRVKLGTELILTKDAKAN